MSFEEQIMSADKYSSMYFLSKMEAAVFFPYNFFQNIHSFQNWGAFLDIPQF